MKYCSDEGSKTQNLWLSQFVLVAGVQRELREVMVERAKGTGLRVGLLNLVGEMLQGKAIDHYQQIWDAYASGKGVMYFEAYRTGFYSAEF